MKRTRTSLLLLVLSLVLMQLQVNAQIAVSIRILPPYPTKITDYSSQPQLMVIGVRNTTDKPQQVQLRGAITGDNGVELRIKPTYRSRNAIALGPFETRTLNGNDLHYFFDYTQLLYKGITQNEFINKNGLPEGSYQFCLRAYDYNSNSPLSADEPVGCSNIFTISAIEPPIILNPIDRDTLTNTQAFIIRWNTPGTTKPNIRYRIRMVEIFGNKSPNNAMLSSVQPPFFEKEVMGNAYVYNPADPQLTPGRSYALMVQAFDPMNQAPFRNNGRSEVMSFTYKKPATGLPPLGQPTPQLPIMAAVPNAAPITEPQCSCTTSVPNGTNANNLVQANITQIKVNNFTMKVVAVQKQSNGKLSGTGTIPLPFIGTLPGASLRVEFNGLDVVQISASGPLVMTGGSVDGIVSGQAMGFTPAKGQPMTLSPDKLGSMEEYLNNTADHLLTNVKNSASSAGFELPLSLNTGPVNVGIMRIHFSAKQAWFDAGAVVNIPDGNNMKLGLAGKDICMSDQKLCGEGMLYLSDDLAITTLGLTLKKHEETSQGSGTSITFDKAGFKSLHIDAEYQFPDGTLVKSADGSAAKLRIKTDTEKGWGDWIGYATIDPFNINGLADFKFTMTGDNPAENEQIVYDHSATQNAANMPAQISSGDGKSINTSSPTWEGLFIPVLKVQLPSAISNINKQPLTITASNMIFQGGFTGFISAEKPLTLAAGSLGGWYCSVDHVGISFFQSSLTSGSMTGKLILPPSGKLSDQPNQTNNQLDYSCNLSAPGGDVKFQFEVHPRNDLKFSALWANVKIAESSNITITAGGTNGFVAKAVLNGGITIQPNNIDKLSNLTLGYMDFQDMTLSTDNGFSPGDFSMGLGPAPGNGAVYNTQQQVYAMDNHGYNAQLFDNLTAPAPLLQQSLMGFNFSVDSIKPYFQENKMGMTFYTRMQLVNGVNFIPKANLDFSVFAKTNAGTDGRSWWEPLGGDINRVHLEADADLAGLKLSGSIDYFNTPAAGGSGNDRGFSGKLDVLLPGFGMNFGMKGMFGSRVNGANSFQFFYIDAMFDMGKTGIMMFPSTALYGFAGGAYYNMERSNETIYSTANSKMPEANDASYMSMKSFSGITYTPKNTQGSTFGFSAGVYFGLQARQTFEGQLTFGMEFHNGALNEVSLDGRGNFFNDGMGTFEQRYTKALGQLDVGIRVQFNNNHFWKFVAHAGAAMKYPPVNSVFTAGGDTELYIENTNANDKATEQDGVLWYFKAGVPWGSAQGQPLHAQFDAKIFKIGAQAYFEVGNYNIDEIPEVPQKIRNIIYGATNEDNGGQFDGQSDVAVPPNGDRPNGSSSGMIMGAMVEFEANPTFAIFYAHLYAGVGADLSLKFYDKDKGQAACATSTSSWYARGQAFIGAKASCGVRVNVFGIKKNIEFASAGVAAIVEAGGPDPLFASGTLGGYFSVLDGLVEGRFNISFTVGQKCTAANTSDQLKLIAQLTPSADVADQTIFTRPAASFNFPLTSDFILTLLDEKTGAKTYTLFRFSKDYITADITGGSQHFTAANLKFSWGGDFDEQNRSVYRKDYSLSLDTKAASLLPLTKYNFTLKAKVKKIAIAGIGGIGKEALQPLLNVANQNSFQWVMDGNSIYEDTRSTSFTTDKGPKNIPIDIVSELLPYHRESAMPLNTLASVSNGYGRIKLIYPMSPENFDLKVTNPRAFARLVKADQGNATVVDIPVEIVDGGATWQFKMPALTPSSTYAIKVFLRGDATASANPTQLVARVPYANLAYKVNDRQLVTNALTMKANEQEMLAWYFKTGNASTYQSKFSSMQLTKMKVGNQEADINKSATLNLQSFNWGPDETTKTINSMGVSYYFKASEAFNKMDVEDQVRNVVLPASPNFDEKKLWQRMMMRSGLEPWYNNVGDIQPIADRFAAVAFGPNKKLIINMQTMEWNPTVGGISTRENVEFPKLTGILSPNQYGVDYKSNNYGQPVDPSGREESSGSSTGSTTGGGQQGGGKIISPASNLIRGINSGTIQGVANLPGYSTLNNSSDYILSYGLGYDAGVGVVEVSNSLIKNVIQQKKDLGYPADIFMDLPGFGAAMDGVQTNSQMSGASMTIAPAGGVKAPQIKIVAPKMNQR